MNEADSKRLQEIKTKIHTQEELFIDNLEDVQWLIAEVERLNAKCERLKWRKTNTEYELAREKKLRKAYHDEIVNADDELTQARERIAELEAERNGLRRELDAWVEQQTAKKEGP